MSLQPGRRLGDFEVLESLGKGGMGEVYRARDTRLQREVALKVVPEAHAAEPNRLARFRRESVVLASLIHPHIATLFGVEESGPVKALVMEVVEGDTLADYIARRADLARGKGLPLEEVLRFASEIAEALEAAHAKGVVHRDLKPANIKVNREGAVKVLDFGLASILSMPTSGVATASTITASGMVTILGTPAYMSPEQARGDAVDQRTDVWAFGCVLYEMLTGRRLFQGDSTMTVLAGVLEREPDLSVVPADTPGSIRRLLRRALTKDSRLRLRDMADARLEIVDASKPHDDEMRPLTQTSSAGRRFWVATAAAAVLGGLLAGGMTWSLFRNDLPPLMVSRFAVALPPGAGYGAGGGGSRNIAISPDGSRMVFSSPRGLVIRQRDRLVFQTLDISNADEIFMPFFSNDGAWVGYFADGRLMKVAVTGGSPVEVTKVSSGPSASWGPGYILFADVTGLYRVDENGGVPERLPVKVESAEQVAFPSVLPDGRSVLFTVMPTRSNTIGRGSLSAQARIDALELASGTQKTVLRGGGRPTYVRTGQLLFGVDQTLRAVAFDPERVETQGEPVEVSSDFGSSEFGVSSDGTLIYVSGRDTGESELFWVDRHGQEQPVGVPRAPINYARLSPDGNRIALDVSGTNRDIWMWDIPRRTLERFTTDQTENVIPAWTRDGRFLAFSSSGGGISNVYWQASDGTGQPERLWETDRMHQPITFAPDGRLLVSEAAPGHGRDVLALSLEPTRSVETLLGGVATEGTAEVSPDGRWIAYDSNESGQFEVYVRPYPRTALGRWRVSTAGGRQPLWSRDGKELYFRDFTAALLAVQVTASSAFTATPPVKLLEGSRYRGGGTSLGGRAYDLSVDGSRFLMLKPLIPPGTPLSIVVTENWFSELLARFR